MRVCKYGCEVLDTAYFENYFMKAIEYFFSVYIASSKHEEGWENSRKLCKPTTTVNKFENVIHSSNISYSWYSFFFIQTMIITGISQKLT